MTDATRPLEGRLALITGASAGIGHATATHLAQAGAAVAVSARRADRLDALVAAIADAGGSAHAIPADAANPDDVDRLWAQAARLLGGTPDLVVANAGRGLHGGVLSSDRSAWESMYGVNVIGKLHLLRIAAEAMADTLAAGAQGPHDLVVLGSVVGTNVSPFSGVYGSTKFAIEAAAEALRREVGGHGVRVTTIKPGIVASEFQEVAGYNEDNMGAALAKFGPMLTPDDIARCIAFTCAQPPNVHVNTLTVRPVGQDYP